MKHYFLSFLFLNKLLILCVITTALSRNLLSQLEYSTEEITKYAGDATSIDDPKLTQKCATDLWRIKVQSDCHLDIASEMAWRLGTPVPVLLRMSDAQAQKALAKKLDDNGDDIPSQALADREEAAKVGTTIMMVIIYRSWLSHNLTSTKSIYILPSQWKKN